MALECGRQRAGGRSSIFPVVARCCYVSWELSHLRTIWLVRERSERGYQTSRTESFSNLLVGSGQPHSFRPILDIVLVSPKDGIECLEFQRNPLEDFKLWLELYLEVSLGFSRNWCEEIGTSQVVFNESHFRLVKEFCALYYNLLQWLNW